MLSNRGLLIYFSYMVYVEIKKNPIKEQEINKGYLLPVHMVSEYHYISQAPGNLYHTQREIRAI